MGRTETTKKLKTIGIHILCWWLFLSLPALFNNHIPHLYLLDIIKDLFQPPRLANGAYYVLLFYFSYYIAIPRLYFTGKYSILAMYLIASFIIFFLINYLMIPPSFQKEYHPEFHLLGASYNLYMYIIVCLFSFALCVYTKWRKIYEEHLSTEISFLKTQINPHFLFNTLNSIYSLTLTKSDDAPEAVLKLSGMMRYAVSDTKQTLVSLEKEINYITDYIDLQRLRLTNEVKLAYNFNGQAVGKQIAPFVLIPFIENAFKYGVNSEENSEIVVNIATNDRSVELTVTNKKVSIQKNGDNGAGVGISNTRKRLSLIYPGKHVLTIKDDENDFSVFLKIDLT